MYNSADVTWTLVGAFLVFFMQAGFALCEAGLTRAKNTGNILMKNMMDFCIGTPCYWLVGFGIMFAGSGALIGGFDPFIRGSYDFGTLPVWVYAVFQTVFCATAATIVSGSMAERTKFSAYCCYSAAISLIVYPISGHWIWGGGFAKLGVQLLGIVSVAAWVLATMFIIFTVIKKTIGLRVSEKEEIDGLDYHEHGLASAYAGFAINDPTYAELDVNENTDLGEDDITKASPEKISAAVKVVKDTPLPAELDSGMHKVSIIVQLAKFETLKKALNDIGVTGMTVTQVMGCGLQKGSGEKYRGAEVDATLLPKVKVEVVVSKIPVDKIIDTATKALYTGHIGDGKIFVYNVAKVVKVRTGEQDYAALQDVE